MHVRSAGIIYAAPEQLGQNVVIGKIGETGTVLVGLVRRSLGCKVLVEALPRLFGSGGVDLAPVISRTLVASESKP